MKIENRENQKIVRETPGCMWFLGVFFMLVSGMLLFGTLGGFSNWTLVPQWQLALSAVIAASGLFAGFWMITIAPVTTLVIDRVDRTVTMRRRGLFSKTTDVFRFDEIERFCLIEELDSDGDKIWSLGFHLTNDETIEVTSLALHDELYQQRIVFEVNEYIGKQLPATEMIIESEDEANEQMS